MPGHLYSTSALRQMTVWRQMTTRCYGQIVHNLLPTDMCNAMLSLFISCVCVCHCTKLGMKNPARYSLKLLRVTRESKAEPEEQVHFNMFKGHTRLVKEELHVLMDLQVSAGIRESRKCNLPSPKGWTPPSCTLSKVCLLAMDYKCWILALSQMYRHWKRTDKLSENLRWWISAWWAHNVFDTGIHLWAWEGGFRWRPHFPGTRQYITTGYSPSHVLGCSRWNKAPGTPFLYPELRCLHQATCIG